MDVRKIHSYISLLISVQLLLWTVSGLYFSFNKIEKIRGEHYYRALDKGNTSSDYDTVEMISKSNAFSIITRKNFPNTTRVRSNFRIKKRFGIQG